MSAPPWANKAKVCVRCKRDCSGIPRIRNPQGQYMCRECYDREALHLKEKPAGGTEGAEGAGGEIALEEIVNSGEGLGAGTRAAVDPSRCPNCATALVDNAVVCKRCGMNITTGEFSIRPMGIRGKCIKCGYDLKGLKNPRCPECGTVNTRSATLHAPVEQTLADSYLRPAIYFVLGVAIALGIVVCRAGWSAGANHLVLLGAAVVASFVAYMICAALWLGFEAPPPVIGARIAGIVALADAASRVGALIPFSGMVYVLPAVGYVALLLDLFDIDHQDAVVVTLITALFAGAGVLLVKLLLHL